MYHKQYVIPLILVFLIGFFTPYWYNAMAGTFGYVPELKKPAGECVEGRRLDGCEPHAFAAAVEDSGDKTRC